MDYDKLRKIKEQYRDKWLKYDDIQAIGIGYKIVKGTETEVPAVRVYTSKKKPLHDVPKNQRIPSIIDQVPIDVIQQGPVLQSKDIPYREEDNHYIEDDPNRYRPLCGGIQVAFLKVKSEGLRLGVGTLGMFVRKKGDMKSLYLLTNGHVVEGASGDVFQPTYSPSRSEKLIIGEASGGKVYEYADAGIAKISLDEKAVDTETILELGKIKGILAEPIRLGQFMKKRGRTTGVTHSRVDDIDMDAYTATHLLKHQIRMVSIDEDKRPVYDNGDSGSVLLTHDLDDKSKSNYVAGLTWGFTADKRTSIASPINYVFEALNVEMCK